MKKLENYGVQEMGSKEMKNVDGGVFPWVPVIVLAIYCFDNREKFIEGLKIVLS